MIQQILCTSFKKELLQGIHDFRTTGDVFKISLYYDTATLNSSTTSYNDATFEIEATGYTMGGNTLINVDPASYGTVGYTSFVATTWTSPDIIARGALIYNSTVGTKPSVMVLDFGMNRLSESGVFTITFPTVNSQYAIIRIT